VTDRIRKNDAGKCKYAMAMFAVKLQRRRQSHFALLGSCEERACFSRKNLPTRPRYHSRKGRERREQEEIESKSRSSLTLDLADIRVRGFVAHAAADAADGWSGEKIEGFRTNFSKLFYDDDERDVDRWQSQVSAHEGIVKATIKAGEGNESMVVPPARSADTDDSK